MNTDIALVLGLVIAAFSIPSILSALSDGRSPRAPMVVILISGALILYAVVANPGGYTVSEIPNVFMSVVNSVIR